MAPTWRLTLKITININEHNETLELDHIKYQKYHIPAP